MTSDGIVHTFFKFQHELKLYHWQTFSYSRHKASDKLYERIIDLIDTFIETFMGKYGKRVQLSKRPLVIRSFTDKTILRPFKQFQAFLSNMETILPKGNQTDLLNIRDEMLGAVNQTLYLFTLR
jgi:hypothetical protein